MWALGTLALYGIALRRTRSNWLLHHDRRAWRDLLGDLALFITALASTLAIVVVVIDPGALGIRGLLSALALGAFTGVGIVKVTVPPRPENPARINHDGFVETIDPIDGGRNDR